MSWWRIRLARVAAASTMLAGTPAPCAAASPPPDLVHWFGAAAAPALQAAAPSNDPALAGRETLKRALSVAYAQLQEVGPAWLDGVRLEIALDPTFRPSYGVSVMQPLLRTADREVAIDVSGGFHHDPAGRTEGHLGLRYHGRLAGRDAGFGVQASLEDHWLVNVQRYTIESEIGLGPLGLRASAFDEVHHDPAVQQFRRGLDGYALSFDARVPYLPWISAEARRSWQVAADGEMALLGDRLSLRLTPLTALEIEAGTQSDAALRSWFAHLRCRVELPS